MKTRHMRLQVKVIEVQTGWKSSALLMTDASLGKPTKKVTLEIESPSDIAYIRERLSEIEESWRRQLRALDQ